MSNKTCYGVCCYVPNSNGKIELSAVFQSEEAALAFAKAKTSKWGQAFFVQHIPFNPPIELVWVAKYLNKANEIVVGSYQRPGLPESTKIDLGDDFVCVGYGFTEDEAITSMYEQMKLSGVSEDVLVKHVRAE